VPRRSRYGENPHQRGARYRILGGERLVDSLTQHAGTALTDLNPSTPMLHGACPPRLKADAAGHPGSRHHQARQRAAARQSARPWPRRYSLALEADPSSAFGGIVAASEPIDAELRPASSPRAPKPT
jgi:phosphoribosylaminoimidazolecarboxamide formyltransferase/IMP cyclohydrolase